jgi:hypothetical protein
MATQKAVLSTLHPPPPGCPFPPRAHLLLEFGCKRFLLLFELRCRRQLRIPLSCQCCLQLLLPLLQLLQVGICSMRVWCCRLPWDLHILS